MSDIDLLLTVLDPSSAGMAAEVRWVGTAAQNLDLAIPRRWYGFLGKTSPSDFMDGQIDLATSPWSGCAGPYAEYCGVCASFWLE